MGKARGETRDRSRRARVPKRHQKPLPERHDGVHRLRKCSAEHFRASVADMVMWPQRRWAPDGGGEREDGGGFGHITQRTSAMVLPPVHYREEVVNVGALLRQAIHRRPHPGVMDRLGHRAIRRVDRGARILGRSRSFPSPGVGHLRRVRSGSRCEEFWRTCPSISKHSSPIG